MNQISISPRSRGGSAVGIASDEMVFGSGFGKHEVALHETLQQATATNQDVAAIEAQIEEAKIEGDAMQLKLEAAREQLALARAKKEHARTGLRSHRDKYARDEQLLSNLKFEIEELQHEMESTQLSTEKETMEVSDLTLTLTLTLILSLIGGERPTVEAG